MNEEKDNSVIPDSQFTKVIRQISPKLFKDGGWEMLNELLLALKEYGYEIRLKSKDELNALSHFVRGNEHLK